MMTFKLLIVDAMIIIHGHEFGFWKSLTSNYKIFVTSIVRTEAFFYKDGYGRQIPINLEAEISNGSIQIIEATAENIFDFQAVSTSRCNAMIHSGELEAIALLKTGQYDDYRYCTGDGAAIKVMSAHRLGSIGVSLEDVLKNIHQEHKLPNQSYSKKYFQKCLGDGISERDLIVKNEKH